MMRSRNSAALVAVIAVTLVSLFLFRRIPVSRIWNSYTVVYADKSLSEETVLALLAEEGCEGVISLGRQRIPFVSDYAPVVPPAEREYLRDRLRYFSDASDSCRVYYVPKPFGSLAARALDRIVRESGAFAGIDGRQQFPWVVPLVAALTLLAFLLASQNRLPFLAAAALCVPLSLSQPFCPVAAACVLYMLSAYLGQRVWGRRKAARVVRRNKFVLIPLAVALALLALCGWQCALMAALLPASSYGALRLLREAEKFFDSRNSFRVVKIIGAPQLLIMHPGAARGTLLSLVPLLALLAAFALAARFAPDSRTKVSLPVPVDEDEVSEEAVRLPVMEDFYKWSWLVMTLPYRSLNDAPLAPSDVRDGDIVSMPRFEEGDDGIIASSPHLMKYDDGFRDERRKSVESLEFDAIEKLMLRQGGRTRVIYSERSKSYAQADGISLALILAAMFVPALMLFLYSLGPSVRRKK